jgi:hypothetical protein
MGEIRWGGEGGGRTGTILDPVVDTQMNRSFRMGLSSEVLRLRTLLNP